MKSRFLPFIIILCAVVLTVSCNHQTKQALPSVKGISGADSIARIDAHLSFMGIYLGKKFDNTKWSNQYGVKCCEDDDKAYWDIYRMYKFTYLQKQLKVTIYTLSDSTVYEIQACRYDISGKDLWDSCHNVFGENNAKHDVVKDMMAAKDSWSYRNQTISIFQNISTGNEITDITFTDVAAKNAMEQAQKKAMK